jgi:hypothetical protein
MLDFRSARGYYSPRNEGFALECLASQAIRGQPLHKSAALLSRAGWKP